MNDLNPHPSNQCRHKLRLRESPVTKKNVAYCVYCGETFIPEETKLAILIKQIDAEIAAGGLPELTSKW